MADPTAGDPSPAYLELLGRYVWEVQHLEGVILAHLRDGTIGEHHLTPDGYENKPLGVLAVALGRASKTTADPAAKRWLREASKRAATVAKRRNHILHAMTGAAADTGEPVLVRGDPRLELTSQYLDDQRQAVAAQLDWFLDQHDAESGSAPEGGRAGDRRDTSGA